MDITKNIFSRAYDGLFGPSSPITNEPTIDYNETIHSWNTNSNPSSKKLPNSNSNNRIPLRYGEANRYDPNHFEIEDDSDDELNNDMNMIYNQFTETNSRLSDGYGFNNARDYNPPASSLPSNYPGSFNFSEPKSDHRNNELTNRNRPTSSPAFQPKLTAGTDDKFYGRDARYNLFADSKQPTSNFLYRNEPEGLDSSTRRPATTLESRYNSSKQNHNIPNRYNHLSSYFPSSSDYKIPSSRPSPSKYNQYEPNSSNNFRSNLLPSYNDPTSRFKPKSLILKDPLAYKPSNNSYDEKLTRLNSKINRYANRESPSFGVYQDPSPTTDDTINNQIKKLEQEIDKESLTKINTHFNKENISVSLQQLKQLNDLNDHVLENNDFLQQLNTLVDINNDSSIQIKEFEKYNELREDYIKELHNYQDFYLNYLKLFKKYRSIKNTQRNHLENDKIISKLNLIKDTTNELSIKAICNNLLNEIK